MHGHSLVMLIGHASGRLAAMPLVYQQSGCQRAIACVVVSAWHAAHVPLPRLKSCFGLHHVLIVIIKRDPQAAAPPCCPT